MRKKRAAESEEKHCGGKNKEENILSYLLISKTDFSLDSFCCLSTEM